MIKKKEEIINYINSLENFSGYVQFSHRPIDKAIDIFLDGNINIKDDDGFIYEAHFYNKNEKKSIQIRQINGTCLVSDTDLTKEEFDISYQDYISDIKEFNYKIKMAQIWETKSDNLCEGMEVKKLTKVVFAGFAKGDSK